MKTVLSVAAIQNGTVIDHIPAGSAHKILQLLDLASHRKKISIGMNLSSISMGMKDLIKIEERFISEDECCQIAIFAPHAKINIIDNYQVIKKYTVTLPKTLVNLISCPNPKCITHVEMTKSTFEVISEHNNVLLQCRYCEKRFSHDAH